MFEEEEEEVEEVEEEERESHYHCKPEVKIDLMQHPYRVNKPFISPPLKQRGT